MQTETYTTEKEAKKAAARDYRPAIVRLPNGVAMGVSRLGIFFRRVRVRLVAGVITSGVRMTSRLRRH